MVALKGKALEQAQIQLARVELLMLAAVDIGQTGS
jgi:hypothetical protein